MSSHKAAFTEQVRESTNAVARYGAASMGALYDLTAVRLVRYAVTLTRNQHDAEDAVHASLVRVATHPRRLSRARHPWAYLLRMVRNEALTIARRQRRVRLRESLSDLLTCCPVDEADREETYRRVWKSLRRLPPEQAEVVVLKIWEGMTFAEIGQVLDKSPNTVASRYQYAMQKLTMILQPLRPEVPCD